MEREPNPPAAVQIIVAPEADSASAPTLAAPPVVELTPAPTTDPEVTRLAQELGTVQAEVTTLRAELSTAQETAAALNDRLTALETMPEMEEELEEIDVPAPAPTLPDASAAVPVAAGRERGPIARLFLGR